MVNERETGPESTGKGPRDEDPGARKEREERDPFREGIRQGMGFLAAIRDTLEEAIEEARQRGDLSQERAQEAVRRAVARAQEAAAGARERIDFAGRRELEALERRVDDLERRLRVMEASGGAPGSRPGSDDPAGGP